MNDSRASTGDPVDLEWTSIVEQLVNRISSGEIIELSEEVNRFPEYQQQLSELLPAMQLMCDWGKRESSNLGVASESVVPTSLGDFQILKEIGRGGMGVVYQARQLSLDRYVALKVLPFAALLDDRQLQRFKNEARAAASLKHANIVSIYTVGCERSVHFYAMELIQGQDMAEAIRQLHGAPDTIANGKSNVVHDEIKTETIPVASLSTQRSDQRIEFYRSVAHLGAQVAEALHFAHQEGVIHRDIKPANLLLDRHGIVHVTDFGLARIPAQDELTLTGDLVGTLRYMSPEQIDADDAVDRRTDVYSLGLTLYELVAGQPAFPEVTRQQLMRAIVEKEPQPLDRLDPKVPRDLQTIIEKAIAKDPRDRYRNAQGFSEDLHRLIDNRTISAKPISPLARASRYAKRNPLVAGLLLTTTVFFAVIAAGASTMAWKFSENSKRESIRSRARETELRNRNLEIYARDIQLANTANKEGDRTTAERLLLKWVPKPGEEEFRGVEWYHLWQRSHPTGIVRSISHDLKVNATAFSPDGTKLADAFYSTSVPIWDLTKPVGTKPVVELPAESMDIYSAKTFVDKKFLALGDKLGNTYLWNWDSLEPVMPTIKCDTGTAESVVSSVDLDPDGRYLALAIQGADDRGRVTIFDLVERRIALEKTNLSGWAYAAFDQHGRLVIGSGQDDRLHVVEIPSGKSVRSHRLNGDLFNLSSLAVSKGRELIAIALEQRLGPHREIWVEVRGLKDWSERLHFTLPSKVRSLDFSNDNLELAVGDYEGTLWIAELDNKRISHRRIHNGRITSVTYSPDNTQIATSGIDKLVHLFGADWIRNAEPTVVRCAEIEMHNALGAVFVNAHTVATSRADRFVDIWNAFTGKLVKTFELKPGFGTAVRLESHPDKNLLAAAQMQWPPYQDRLVPGRVIIWDTKTWNRKGQHEIPNEVIAVNLPFSSDGRLLAVPGREWTTVIDVHQETKRTVKFRDWVKTCDFSPDNRSLICALITGETHTLDATTLKPVRRPFITDQIFAHCIDFVPRTNLLAVVGFQNRLQLFDAGTGDLVRSSERYPGFLGSVRVSPDGSRIGVGARDGKFRLFRTEDCEELISFDVPPYYCYCDFSPDGNSVVVSAGRDTFVFHGTDRDELEHLSISQLRDIACQHVGQWKKDR